MKYIKSTPRISNIVHRYSTDYKTQAVELGRELGVYHASLQLGIPQTTLQQWMHKNDIASKFIELKKENEKLKEKCMMLEKEINYLKQRL